MKFSEQWLREWVNPPIDSEALATQLTMAGLEVESLSSAAHTFSGVFVGHVLSVAPHPDADRLRVCSVNVGESEPIQVVCGGANVRAGLKVPVARIGAVMPEDFKITQSKLRGVDSYGMICSTKELGLSEESSGIMELPEDAPIGRNIRDYLKLNDQIIEIDFTPNRGDCLSIQGIAREVGAINSLGQIKADSKTVTPTLKEIFPVNVSAPERCPRYFSRVIRHINTNALTPIWMQERLRRGGVRCIHPVVDVMNYVMLELGQPMHAFDLDKLQGGIEIRLANSEESLEVLDGRTITLAETSLVIADQNQAQALAGIIGGQLSAVGAGTQNLFLESAFFTPKTLGVEARHYGIQTDSSYRFERGVDFELPRVALERATQLLVEIVGGEVGPVNEATQPSELPSRGRVKLSARRLEQILGLSIDSTEVEGFLSSLGVEVLAVEDGWNLRAPSFRYDLEIEADYIEEVARLYGYDRIPASPAHPAMKATRVPVMKTDDLARLLQDRGYHEIISYSFVDPALQALLHPNEESIRLINPMSQDLSVMRHSLWPGLMAALQHNLARQCDRVRMFETGLCFVSEDGEWHQRPKIGGLMTGGLWKEQWGSPTRPVDFFDLKTDLEALLSFSRIEAEWHPLNHNALHPGQSALLKLNGKVLGYAGALHPSVMQALGLEKAIYLFELDLELLKPSKGISYQPLSKFPSVRRDLSLLVERTLPIALLEQKIREDLGECLKSLIIFDIYDGQHIEKSKKSVAMGLIFQDPDRTLVDEEINALVARALSCAEREFEAKLRI